MLDEEIGNASQAPVSSGGLVKAGRLKQRTRRAGVFLRAAVGPILLLSLCAAALLARWQAPMHAPTRAAAPPPPAEQGIPSAALPPPEAPILDSSVSAIPPYMPLLAKWVKMLKEGKAPKTVAPLRLLTPEPLPGVDWSAVAPCEMGAQLFERGREFWLNVDYGPTANTSGADSDGFGSQCYLCTGGRVRRLSKAQSDKIGFFLDSTDEPRVVLSKRAGRHGPARAAVLRVHGDTLQISPIRLEPRLSQDPLYLHDNEKTGAQTVVDDWTGATVSRLPAGEGAQAVAVVGDHPVLADVDMASSENCLTPSDFVWLRRPLAGGRWTRHHLPIVGNYCRKILPGFLGQGHFLNYQDFQLDTALWKDGSIIWRFACEEREGLDEIHCVGLAMQPPRGRSRLLACAVYDRIVGEAIQTTDLSPVEAAQAAAVPDRVWLPTRKGFEWAPAYEEQWCGDFWFDVDWANNAVIYLLGGRLWAIDMSRLRPS